MNQDREFEKYLQGHSGLSKLHAELPEVELPDHLDAAILAEAHRAVGARPGKPKRRWTIPLGLVATLFVAVMAGLQLPYMLKESDQVQQLKEERMAALNDKSAAERASVEPLARKIQEMDKAVAKQKSGMLRSEPAPGAAVSEMPASVIAPVHDAPREAAANESHQLDAMPLVASPAAPAPAMPAKRPELRERADAGNGMALSKEKKSVGRAEGLVSEPLQKRAAPAAKMATPHPAQLERGVKAEEANLSPADWLARIKRLKQEGKLEEAEKELAALRKRYPDFLVPEALELR